MDRLPIEGLEAFLAIVEHGSLRRAATALRLRPPAVSQRLKSIEERLGVALFVRTTRSVRLTDAGQALLVRAKPTLAALVEALEEARQTGPARRGTLRITLPYVAHERAIAPRLAVFRTAYPDIELDLSFNEAFVDVVAAGFHAGIRLGDHIEQDMIAVRLTPPFRQVTFAAPSYLDRRGRPKRPDDLLGHDCIRYRYIASQRPAAWQFKTARGIVEVGVKGGLIVNSTQALVQAARDGLGISWLFRPNIEADLDAGALESVLDRFAIERPGYFIYFPRAHQRLGTLRAFIDVMRA